MNKPREWTIEWDNDFNYQDGVPANIQIATGDEVGEHERAKVIEKSAYEKLEADKGSNDADYLKLSAENGNLREEIAGLHRMIISSNRFVDPGSIDSIDSFKMVMEENERLQSQKPVPMCIIKHTAPIGHTASLDRDNCVVCKENEKLKARIKELETEFSKALNYGQAMIESEWCGTEWLEENLKPLVEARKVLEKK